MFRFKFALCKRASIVMNQMYRESASLAHRVPNTDTIIATEAASGCPFAAVKSKFVTESGPKQTFSLDFQNSASSDTIPGPVGKPIVGTLFDYIGKRAKFDFKKMFLAHKSRFAEYGPIYQENICGKNMIIMKSVSEWLKQVINAETSYPKRSLLDPMERYRTKRKLYKGLPNAQGKDWSRVRTAINPIMLKPDNLESHYSSSWDVSETFVNMLENKIDQKTNQVHDIENELFKWVLEAMTINLFGKSLGCLDQEEKPRTIEFVKRSRRLFVNMQLLMWQTPIMQYFPTKQWKQFVEDNDVLIDYSYKLVQGTHKNSLLSGFLRNKNIDPKVLAVTASDLFIGSMETTVKSLLWTLYCLSKEKECQARLQNLIDIALKGEKEMTAEIMREMRYMKACVWESLRMYPPAPVLVRELQTDSKIHGHRVKKGETVMISLWSVARDKKIFPQPEKFLPDRWLDSSQPRLQKLYKSLPFGHGKRMCVGRRVAEMQIYCLLAKMLQNYTISYVGEQPIEPVVDMMLSMDRPLELKFTKRHISEFK